MTSDLVPHCIGCKYEFEDDFIIENINYTFFNSELKKKQMEIYTNIERARIPLTMDAVNTYLYNRKVQEVSAAVLKELALLKINYNKDQRRLKREYDDNYYIIRSKLLPANKVGSQHGHHFTMKCQSGSCNGYLSSSYKCAICDKYTCSKCLDVLGLYNKESFDNHSCDADQILSVTAIKHDTRPCPTCATRIYKTAGCDQMWCTSCNNAFSWNTGQMVSGVIHNPHYFEYLQHNSQTQAPPRNPLDIICGGIPDIRSLLEFTNPFMNLNYNYIVRIRQTISSIQSILLHIEHGIVDIYNINEHLEKHRIDFILKKISLPVWSQHIFMCKRKDKQRKFDREIRDLIHNVGGDLLRNYYKFATDHPVNPINAQDDIDIHWQYVEHTILNEFIQIVSYTNKLKIKKAHILKTNAELLSVKAHNISSYKVDNDYLFIDKTTGKYSIPTFVMNTATLKDVKQIII